MGRTLKVTLVAGLAACVLVSVGPAPSAGEPTYVTHNCEGTKLEPRQIMFACGDGNYYVDGLKWNRWETRRAAGRGTFHFNDCKPNCAEGTFHERTGKIVLKRRRACDNTTRKVFKRALVTYDQPYKGERESTERLFCPFG